jgi:PAS domain S-box-containing protein
MAREGGLIGALSVVTRDAMRHFADDDQALLAGLANQAALAIANARLLQDVRLAEAKYRGIFEDAVEGIVQLRPDWRILSANPAFTRMLGYTLTEPAQLSMAELLTVDQECVAEFVQLIREHNRVQGFEMPVQLRDGRMAWLSINARAVCDASGEMLYYEGFVEDVTLRKQVQERMVRTDRLAAVGQLAASVAHEINNPLQSIVGCLGLAQEALESGEEARQYLKVARDEVRRISRIVGRMREMYRPESDEKVSMDLNALVEQVVDLVRKRCQEEQIELDWQPAQNLPSLFIVPDQIKQVLLNLLLNAIDATPGGGQLRLSTALAQEPGGIQIAVADNGSGIPPEVLPHIFDAFYSTKPTGSGLGLAISSNIVAKHDGHIKVESQVGRGSTFTVWLPLSAAMDA